MISIRGSRVGEPNVVVHSARETRCVALATSRGLGFVGTLAICLPWYSFDVASVGHDLSVSLWPLVVAFVLVGASALFVPWYLLEWPQLAMTPSAFHRAAGALAHLEHGWF